MKKIISFVLVGLSILFFSCGGSIGVGFQGKVSNLSGDAAFGWCVPVRITAGF